MPSHKTKVRRKRQAAKNTVAVELEKPAGFTFTPGDHVAFELPNFPRKDPQGNWRAFSIASAPHDDHLLFASRLTDNDFKKAVGELEVGDEILISDPSGGFELPQQATFPLMLFAGGIGITPFRSMIKYVVEQATPHQLTLVCANRHPEDALFHDELTAWDAGNPRFTYIPVITRPAGLAGWAGHTGHIDHDFMTRYLRNVGRTLYYLAGTPRFVTSVRQLLLEHDVPEFLIRTDEFDGY